MRKDYEIVDVTQGLGRGHPGERPGVLSCVSFMVSTCVSECMCENECCVR
jgi:hypothetical protein